MYLCVDFDGTIVDHRFPDIGPPVPGAIWWIKTLQKALDAKIILFTMRSNREGERLVLTEATKYVLKAGINLFGVNENPDQHTWTSSPKVYGNFYIDDAAAGCPLIQLPGFARPCVDWEAVGVSILKARQK